MRESGATPLVSCYAAGVLNFLITFKKGVLHFNFVSGNTRYVADPDNVGWEFLGVSNDIKTVATTGLEQKKKKFEEGNTYKVFSEWMALSET